MKYLEIGGVSYPVDITKSKIDEFFVRWHKMYSVLYSRAVKEAEKAISHDVEFREKKVLDFANEKVKSYQVPDYVFFQFAWSVLVKKGFWLWKKPFRNMYKLIKSIRQDEFIVLVQYVGSEILKINYMSDVKEAESRVSGKKPKVAKKKKN